MRWMVHLDDVDVHVRVGVLPFEREAPQRLCVQVGMVVEYPSTPESLAECVDYAEVYHAIQAWKTQAHTPLLETLAHTLAAWIISRWPQVVEARCRVSKPDIFPHARSVGVECTLVR